MTLHWGIAILDSVFIGDTVTLLDILHWDTLLSLMVDFSRWWLILRHDYFKDCACIEGWHWPCFEDTYWGIVVSLAMDYDLSWSIVTSDGLYWSIADMESIFHGSIVALLDPLHWGISIFWREIRLFLYIGASTDWYGDHWIISCCPHCILGHSRLVECFDIEIWLSVHDYYFWWITELLTPRV